MKHFTFWLVVIVIAAGIQLFGRMASSPKAAKKIAPASVLKIDGTTRARVTLLPEAAKRLDIKTAPVREEVINPVTQVAGEVINVGANSGTAVVRVELTESEVSKVRQDRPVSVLPLARDSKARRIQAQPLSGVVASTLSLDSTSRRVRALPSRKPGETGATPGLLHYEVNDANHGFVNRQLVLVELALSDGSEKRKIIPYAAVLYDAKGGTWVYTNPEPLVFTREPIKIETIIGDDVLLTEGPPAATTLVVVGGAELWGTEFGVGK